MNNNALTQEEIDNLLKGDGAKKRVPLTDPEVDALGELFNISMGTAATTLSNLIGKKVEITTPRVTSITLSELQSEYPLPYVAVDIHYTEGLVGKNLLIIKIRDAAVIVDLMMGGDGSNPSETLDDICLSAIGEAMNQMIGSGATSISAMFRKKVNISPPSVRVLNFAADQSVINEDGEENEQLIKVVFRMFIEDLIESEMMQLIPVSFAKQISDHLLADVDNEEKVQQELQRVNNTEEAALSPENRDDCVEKEIRAQPVQFAPLEGMNGPQNIGKLSMILDVPLELLVELGRTQKTISEILNLGRGAIVELDKFSNEPVDIYINGKPIAKGEIVVIGDNYGVRITEILSSVERIKNLR